MTREAQIWRTAVTLPWLLIGVALLSSLRFTMDGEWRILPPTLSALVLSLAVVTLLVRCGQLAPTMLVDPHGSSTDRLVGLVVVVSLWWASAAVMALVVPEAGLPKLAGLILVAALLANTLAASAGRVAALRALVVTCLAGFVIKFIVLDALFAPARSLTGRLLTSMLEGATFGTLVHEPWAPATGYLAFGTLMLYFLAIVLLPHAPPPDVTRALETSRTIASR